MLVSLPYPFGPDEEVCCLEGEEHARFPWLPPATEAQKWFRHEPEALERRIQDARLKFAVPWRESVV